MDQRPLISPLELAALLRSGPGSAPLLLDVRWSLGYDAGFDDYMQGHLPGALFVDLERDLSGTASDGHGGRHPMPHPDDFELDMAESGVDNGRMVVVYDDGHGVAAARCWWVLRHFGKFDVAVLDGGLRHWTAHRLPVESGLRTIEEGDFDLGRGVGRVVDADEAALYAAEGVLIDARSPERFRGESDPVDLIRGHIPGAVNLPALSLLAADGTLLPVDQLRSRFAEVGVDGSRPVATYCGSGVASSLVALALAVCELDMSAAMYVGSWSDWITDPSRPVETGAGRAVEASLG
ncbi:sulfurtransferase [Austwickia sp. TVS 96-490-7B]|uniref:sulfurtransferase n=1 Tax=Austwickia sp. TVS 96-490-7B TaxID=2830843 RepID=UPI001C58B5EC|nr:sulfurtransferase [Austwickia sp. TVS 96-490-7B]